MDDLLPILEWCSEHVAPHEEKNHWCGDGWYIEVDVINGFRVSLNVRDSKLADMAALKFA